MYISLCGWSIICAFIFWWTFVYTRALSSLGLLQIKLLGTFVHKCLYGHIFSSLSSFNGSHYLLSNVQCLECHYLIYFVWCFSFRQDSKPDLSYSIWLEVKILYTSLTYNPLLSDATPLHILCENLQCSSFTSLLAFVLRVSYILIMITLQYIIIIFLFLYLAILDIIYWFL